MKTSSEMSIEYGAVKSKILVVLITYLQEKYIKFFEVN